MYKDTEDHQAILDHLKSEATKGKSDEPAEEVSMVQAMTNPKYRKATWIGIILCVLYQQTAIDGLLMYSNSIFLKLKEKGSISYSAKVGSYIVALI